jgi:hypothetical protein
MKLKQLASGVKFRWKSGAKLAWDKRDDWHKSANDYRCQIEYQGRKFTFDYWHGSGITHDPRKADCLDSLLSDAQAGEQTFEDFCGDFGYDTDSISHRRTWKACARTAANLRRVFGDDFDKFIGAERD